MQSLSISSSQVIYEGPMHEYHEKGFQQRMTSNLATEALTQCSPCRVLCQLSAELHLCVEVLMCFHGQEKENVLQTVLLEKMKDKVLNESLYNQCKDKRGVKKQTG